MMILYWLVSLAMLVCFILVVVKMFQNGATALGIITIICIFCGIGSLIALIAGWIKADQWRIRNLMLAYTGVLILYIILFAVNYSAIMAQFQAAGH